MDTTRPVKLMRVSNKVVFVMIQSPPLLITFDLKQPPHMTEKSGFKGKGVGGGVQQAPPFKSHLLFKFQWSIKLSSLV